MLSWRPEGREKPSLRAPLRTNCPRTFPTGSPPSSMPLWRDRQLRGTPEYFEFYCKLYGSYTSYLSPDTVKEFFSDCPDRTNVLEAERTMRECLQENCSKKKTQLRRLQPTEDEFLALLGIAFWSISRIFTIQVTEQWSRSLHIIHSLAFFDRYRQTIGKEEGAIRIGGLHCL
ncbi:hypothetical protein PMAYCL1PPCAC_16680, partial [Pristionchus mayeri]